MIYRPESLLDGIETCITDGLRRDADGLRRREATARILLALGRTEGIAMGELSRRTARDAILGARATRSTRIVAGVAGRTGLNPDEVDWFLSALYAALVSDAEDQAATAERAADRSADAPPAAESGATSGA